MIYAYVRVSTDIQAEKGSSLTEQQQRLSAYCVAMGWENPQFLIDDGYSAKDINRPSLQKLIQLVEEKKVKRILVTKLDRLSRKLLDLLNLIELFHVNGVSFVSVSEAFDTDTPAGRLTLQVLGAVAEFERERISERVKDNMLSIAKNTDKVMTRPCYGYDIVDGAYKINREEAKYVEMMFALAEQGHGYRKIAQFLNEAGSKTKANKPWAQHSVKRLIHNETVTGTLIYNKRKNKDGKITMRDTSEWVVKEGHHEAIIAPERFQAVQEIFKARQRAHKHADNASYLLTGLVKCKHCGRPMTGNTARYKRDYGEYSYYRYICSSYVKGYGCKHHAVHRDPLETRIIEYVKHFASESSFDVEAKITHAKSTADEINELKGKLASLNKRMQKQIEAYEMDLISPADLKAARERIDIERNRVIAEIEKLESRQGNVYYIKGQASQLLDEITGTDRVKAKKALRELIDFILVDGNEVEIYWRG